MKSTFEFRAIITVVKKLCVLIACCCIITLAGCSLMPVEEPDLPPPVKEDAPAAPETAIVKKGLLEVKSMVAGTFVYNNVLNEVFTYKGGFLKHVYVKPGDMVKKGDLLAELENDNLESRIEQERLNLEKAEANLKQVMTQGHLEIEVARMELDKAVKEYETAAAVTGTMSKAELDTLHEAMETAQDKLAKIIRNYGDESSPKGYVVEQAELMTEESRLRLESMEKELSICRLYAERDGKVEIALGKGTSVNINQTVVRIVDPDDMCWTYFGYMAPKFVKGSEVEIRFTGDAYSVEEIEKVKNVFSGAVTEVNDKEAYDQLKYVKVKLHEMPWAIRDGESAVATLVTDRVEDAVIIPSAAVINRGYLNYVHVIKDGVREEKEIEIGIESGGNTQVLKGLEAGEEVLLN